jgi:hypothetical protein
MIFQEDFPTTAKETLFCQQLALEITELAGGKEQSNKEGEADMYCPKSWTLYFDGSKS